MDEATLKQFARWGKQPPEIIKHGTESDIKELMEVAKPTNWRLVGNELTADTPLGKLVKHIDPSYIMIGVDNSDLPILKKIVL